MITKEEFDKIIKDVKSDSKFKWEIVCGPPPIENGELKTLSFTLRVIDLNTQRVIDQVPLYDSKEPESIREFTKLYNQYHEWLVDIQGF